MTLLMGRCCGCRKELTVFAGWFLVVAKKTALAEVASFFFEVVIEMMKKQGEKMINLRTRFSETLINCHSIVPHHMKGY